jgi:hypothetical protein
MRFTFKRRDKNRDLAYRRGFMHRGFVLRRMIITTVNQGTTQHWIDTCWTATEDGRRGEGYAIHLTPWRRNAWGEIQMGRALVVARLRVT